VKNAGLLLLLVIYLPATAQNYVDILRLHYNNTPPVAFDSGPGETQIQEMGVDITLPIKFNDKTALLTGFFGERINLLPDPFLGSDIQLYSALLKIGINQKYKNNWTGTYMLLPKLSSDMTNINDKDVQMGAYLLLTKEKRPELKYRMGLYANTELFSPFLVPILGMWYQSANKKLCLDLSLPIFGNIDYRLHRVLSTGLTFNAFVRSYYMSSTGPLRPSEHYVMKSTNETLLYLQFYLTKNLLLQTKAGFTIGRYYRIYDLGDKVDFGLSAFKFGDNRTPLNEDLRDGLMFQVRLVYRFHLPEPQQDTPKN
jgi:hypothetical protein